MQIQILKELIKLVDSLRSQVSKNSILTLTSIIELLPAKELDYMIDTILPAFLKKAADTNVFIQESVDKALMTVCSCLSDAKVFTCL